MVWLSFSIWKCVGEVISEKYVLEYGTDCLEMHVGAIQPCDRALVVDDLVATGGTLRAAMNLLGLCNENYIVFITYVLSTYLTLSFSIILVFILYSHKYDCTLVLYHMFAVFSHFDFTSKWCWSDHISSQHNQHLDSRNNLIKRTICRMSESCNFLDQH